MNRRAFLVKSGLVAGGVAGISYLGLLRIQYAAERKKYETIRRFSPAFGGPSLDLEFTDGTLSINAPAPLGPEFDRKREEYEVLASGLKRQRSEHYHESIAQELSDGRATDVQGFPVSNSEMIVLSELKRTR